MHVNGIYKDYQKADIQKQKVDVSISEIYGNRIYDFSSKTVEHIKMMYAELGIKQFFGREDVQNITKLGHIRASERLKELATANIIETVSGHGKGKYRFCDC